MTEILDVFVGEIASVIIIMMVPLCIAGCLFISAKTEKSLKAGLAGVGVSFGMVAIIACIIFIYKKEIDTAIPVDLTKECCDINYVVSLKNGSDEDNITTYYLKGGKDYTILPPTGAGQYTVTIYEGQTGKKVDSYGDIIEESVNRWIWMHSTDYSTSAPVNFQTCQQELREIYIGCVDAFYENTIRNVYNYFTEFSVLETDDASVLFRDVEDTIKTRSGTDLQIAAAMVATLRAVNVDTVVITCQEETGRHNYVAVNLNGSWTVYSPTQGLTNVSIDESTIVAMY